MSDYAYINSETGAVEISNAVPAGVTMWWEVGPAADPNLLFVDGAGDLQQRPPTPGRGFMFDYLTQAWVDRRSASDIAAELDRRRSAARLDKSALVLALREREVLTDAEVIDLASGRIPPRIDAMLADLSADIRTAALVRWGLEQTFTRTHPVVVTAALRLGIDDTTLDQIFGVEAP